MFYLPIKKKSDLVLIDSKTYLDFLKEQELQARRQSYTSKKNDMDQMWNRGRYAAYRNVIKFFENLKSDL